MYKVIVAHPHKQHSYMLAEALHEKGILFSYITTVYYKNGSLTKKVMNLFKGETKKRALSRRCDGLPDEKVVQYGEFFGLVVLALMRLVHNNKRVMNPVNRFVSNYFGRKVAKYAIRNKVDMVICYDNECPELFTILKEKMPNIIRVMDVSAANRLYLKEVYTKDFELCPEFANRLKSEKCELFSESSAKEMKLLKKEIEYSNYFIVPSKFVARSLKFSNVPEEKMIYCNYGVDLHDFPPKQYRLKNKPLKFVYVGGIKELKGIGYLLKAFENIPSCLASLTIVGAYDNKEDVSGYKNVNYTGHVIHSEVEKILSDSDVFVFPSLGDSFSLACLDAAAVGLPLIVSENTGMIDNMTDGEEGFIIPIQNSKIIEEKVRWFAEHPESIEIMGRKARNMASKYSWEEYKLRVSSLIYDICLTRDVHNVDVIQK